MTKATATAPAKIKGARMSEIKTALPEYFSADLPRLVRGMKDEGARVESLAYALTGYAIERAQSGNMPAAFMLAREACASLKGGQLKRVSHAMGLVESVKPGSISAPVHAEAGAPAPANGAPADFATFAADTFATIREALTPPAPAAKKDSDKPSAKAQIEALKAELATVTAERDALAAQVVELTRKLAEKATRKAKASAKVEAPAEAGAPAKETAPA